MRVVVFLEKRLIEASEYAHKEYAQMTTRNPYDITVLFAEHLYASYIVDTIVKEGMNTGKTNDISMEEIFR
jgi:hypothetical protein